MTQPNTADGLSGEDAELDALYPPTIQALSSRFWTPVLVARRAASLFRQAGVRGIVDVGSGVGKFVLAAASVAPDLTFVGVEQRVPLVQLARSARERLALGNASFIVGEATSIPVPGFRGYYFFNPFAENIFQAIGDCIDDTVALNEARFVNDILRVEHGLRAAPLGTAVVTYHGLSGRIPACYELSVNERAGSGWLRLWVKTQERAEGFFLEVDDEVVRHQASDAIA